MESYFNCIQEIVPIHGWDDTMLVKTYNDCVKLLNEDIAKHIARNTNLESTKALDDIICVDEGDYVRATYDMDGCDYEAKIITVDKPNGTCLVKYIGYDNQQTVNLKDLVPSWGKFARRIQFEQAKNYREKYSSAEMQSLGLKGSYFGKVPPPPPMPPMLTKNIESCEHLSAMLMAWYMSGYYTGIYEGVQLRKCKTDPKL